MTTKKAKISPAPQSVESLINEALTIEADQAQEAGALGFMARAMVQATLPHRKSYETDTHAREARARLRVQLRW